MGVAKARQLARDAGVQVDYSICDCSAWQWQDRTHDLVAAIFIQFEFPDPALRPRVFPGMAAALRPSGLLILQGYTPKQHEYKMGGPDVLENLFAESRLRSAFSSLEIPELEEYEADLGEGKRHSGRSALVGMVARACQ